MWPLAILIFSPYLFADGDFSPFRTVSLIPLIVVQCESQVAFGKAPVTINIQEGKATQLVGDRLYTYKLENYVLDRKEKDKKGTALKFHGQLESVTDTTTNLIINDVTILESKFSFKSYIPEKDKSKFRASYFELSSKINYASGSSFNFQDKSQNSTPCVLMMGGKAIKEMNRASSMRTAITYHDSKINDSGRGIQTKDAPGPTSELKREKIGSQSISK